VVFAALSGLCLYAGVVLVAVLWNSRLADLLRDNVAQPWREAIIVVAILLLLFPIYYPTARKLRARLQRPQTSTVPATPTTARTPSALEQPTRPG
jgi:hypothetical protein